MTCVISEKMVFKKEAKYMHLQKRNDVEFKYQVSTTYK